MLVLIAVKSIVCTLAILPIIDRPFSALSDSGKVLARESHNISIVFPANKIIASDDRILLEPNAVITRRQNDKQKEEPDPERASWWEKLMYKFEILQKETEFVDDGVEKTIKGEKLFLMLLIPILLWLFWQNNAKLSNKSSRSHSRRSKR
jgi:hypothetical protein